MTTTTLTIPGYRIVRTLGVVRGVTVRARWIGSQISAAIRTLAGGQIPEYIKPGREHDGGLGLWHRGGSGA